LQPHAEAWILQDRYPSQFTSAQATLMHIKGEHSKGVRLGARTERFCAQTHYTPPGWYKQLPEVSSITIGS